MPTIPITSDEQYENALNVLLRVGGWFHGVGREQKYLLVTSAQYDALVEAGVVESNGKKESRGGKRKKEGANS